jgi:hypothetical protein
MDYKLFPSASNRTSQSEVEKSEKTKPTQQTPKFSGNGGISFQQVNKNIWNEGAGPLKSAPKEEKPPTVEELFPNDGLLDWASKEVSLNLLMLG